MRLTLAEKRQKRRHQRRQERHDLRAGPPWAVHGVGVPPGSVLVDRDYLALVGAKHEIVRNGMRSVTADQACVAIHLGSKAVRLTADRTRAVVEPSEAGTFEIAAGDVLSIESQEIFRLPADVQGQVSPKAKLTTLGLFFPTTHVDPGFVGHLYLPIINAGPRGVDLPVGASVGKVELQRLSSAVQDPWKGSSGFGSFEWHWVQGGPTVAEQRAEMVARIRLLQWAVIALTVAVLALLLSPLISDWLSELDLGDFAEKVLAPALAALIVAGLALIPALVRAKGKSLRERFRLERMGG